MILEQDASTLEEVNHRGESFATIAGTRRHNADQLAQ